MEIRPISERLRKMLHPPVEEESDLIVVGAHILRQVDPLPHLKAHQAACDGNYVTNFLAIKNHFLKRNFVNKSRVTCKDDSSQQVKIG